MNIFIDLTGLRRSITGIENYTLHFAKTLLNMDNKNEYHFLFRRNIHPDFQDPVNLSSRFTFSISKFKSQFLTEQLFIPWFLANHNFDFAFFPCFPPGLFVIHKKLVFLCHDAVMWKYPKTLSLKNKLYFRPLAENALWKASLVCTNSESSREDIGHYFPNVHERTINIGAAISDKYSEFDSAMIPKVLRKFGISRKYLLCVSSLEPRKNIPFIVTTTAEILRKHDLLLVLVGRAAWGRTAIDKAIQRVNISERVVRTGYVSLNDLKCLYSAAEVFLFPSLYEGFGFPILEAFACGCPVITSNVSSMPHVAGDAALLIDPTSEEDMKRAIHAILRQEHVRSALISKGSQQLSKFSWTLSCERFVHTLEKLNNQLGEHLRASAAKEK